MVSELERETHGVGIPKSTREAWRVPLADHHTAFVQACEAAKLSPNTLAKYRLSLPKLFARCKWKTIREVTAQSFTDWRDECGLSPKTVNDLLGSMRTFLLWMKRKRLILSDPLEFVRKVSNPGVGSFRRALSVEEAQRLIAKAPPHRARVYLTMVYTGLRRTELNGLKWGDFNLTGNPPQLRVPSSLSKNKKESIHYLRPEVVEALTAIRPEGVKPDVWVFRGTIPRIPTFKRDLKTAGIPFEDARGRRVDIHALRKTYGTMLASSGVSPRVAMELMRHSDMKLTMGVYTDVSHLQIIEDSGRLPSIRLPQKAEDKATVAEAAVSLETGALGGALGGALPGVFSSPPPSSPVTELLNDELRNSLEDGTLGHEKAPCVTTGRFHQMERAKSTRTAALAFAIVLGRGDLQKPHEGRCTRRCTRRKNAGK